MRVWISFYHISFFYGLGVYFAVNASYSGQQTYSKSDDKGDCYMYYAKVLTGEYTLGSSDMKTAPAKDKNNPHLLYDTTVNADKPPTVFVTYHDDQAYPEYLLTFQRP